MKEEMSMSSKWNDPNTLFIEIKNISLHLLYVCVRIIILYDAQHVEKRDRG